MSWSVAVKDTIKDSRVRGPCWRSGPPNTRKLQAPWCLERRFCARAFPEWRCQRARATQPSPKQGGGNVPGVGLRACAFVESFTFPNRLSLCVLKRLGRVRLSIYLLLNALGNPFSSAFFLFQ